MGAASRFHAARRAGRSCSTGLRAATFGAVETILVDIDQVIPGRIDDQGAVSFASRTGEGNYGVVDEIATRVLATGGRVIGVRKADIRQCLPAWRPRPKQVSMLTRI